MERTLEDAASPTQSRLGGRVATAVVLLALGLVGVDFLLNVYRKYHQLDPAAYTMFWTRRGWLWTHLAGGALTIILGAVQFLTQSLWVNSRVHRWTGRTYITGMAIACAGIAGLIATSPAPFEICAAFTGTALAWVTTAAVGVIAIRSGRVAAHRRWMVRNYLVTLAPVAFRALIAIPGVMGLASPPVMIPLLLTASWLLPLLICEGVYRSYDWSRREQYKLPAPRRLEGVAGGAPDRW